MSRLECRQHACRPTLWYWSGGVVVALRAACMCTPAPSAVDGVVLDMLSKGWGCEGLYCVVSCAKMGCWWLPCAVLLLEV